MGLFLTSQHICTRKSHSKTYSQTERNHIVVQQLPAREGVDKPLRGLSAALFDPALNEEGVPDSGESATFTGGLTPAWLYAESWAISMLNVSLRVLQMCRATDCTGAGRRCAD